MPLPTMTMSQVIGADSWNDEDVGKSFGDELVEESGDRNKTISNSSVITYVYIVTQIVKVSKGNSPQHGLKCLDFW